MKSEKISELTTNRLSVYLRCLNTLHAAGIKTISSQALAEQFNLNSAQIRKDLGYFGEFGVRGVGYYVEDLRDHITKILGLDNPHRVGIVGAGRLGTALANYNGFERSNFTVVALFDNDRQKIGARIGDAKIAVHDVDELAKVIRDEVDRRDGDRGSGEGRAKSSQSDHVCGYQSGAELCAGLVDRATRSESQDG